uniref:Uncharacterized protein n=1 Tax=Cannabis sativa TaxID=3483 RepID=A0A803R5G5_CANSA
MSSLKGDVSFTQSRRKIHPWKSLYGVSKGRKKIVRSYGISWVKRILWTENNPAAYRFINCQYIQW